MDVVDAYHFEGWSLSLFGSPTFTIVCGNRACMCSWRQRIPVVDYPRVPCPGCGTLNRINVTVS